MCKGILAFVFLLSVSLSHAYAGGGVDVGNGGNGIQNADGSVRLDDLAELSIDPDAVVLSNFSSKAMSQNYTVQYAVRKLLHSKLAAGDYSVDERVVNAVATQLSVLSYRYPTFVRKLMDSINTMQWERTPSLEPNQDAKLKLVLAPDQKEIGCAENKFGRVQVSLVCEKNMSPGNFAALLMHEALYAYLASTDSRIAERIEDSTPVRRIVAEVFRSKADEVVSGKDAFQSRVLGITLPGNKEIIGMKELFADDSLVNNTFFPGNRSYSANFACSFTNSDPLFLLKSVTVNLQFKGVYYASGAIRMPDDNPLSDLSCANQIFGYNNRGDATQAACLVNPQYQLTQSWLPEGLPQYDIAGAMIVVPVIKLSSHEKMVLHISMNSDLPSKLEVYRSYNESLDRYAVSFSMDGKCSFAP